MVVGCRWPAGSRCCCRAGGGGDRARRGRPRAAATRSFGRRARPGLEPRRRRASLPRPAERLAPQARASTHLNERQLKAVRIGDHELTLTPRHVHRLLVERAAACLDLGGEPVEVLRRGAAQPRADPLRAIPTLGEIVLIEVEPHRPGEHLAALQRAVFAPLLAHDEAEHVTIKGNASLEIGRGERGCDVAQAQRFRLPPGAGAGARPLLSRRLLSGRHQVRSVEVSKRSEPPRVSPDSPFPRNPRSSRSWRPATLSRFGKASSKTAKAASRRRAACSAARSATALASKVRKGRTRRSCSPPPTPAALAWRSRPLSRRQDIPRTASKRGRRSRSKRWTGRPRSRA